MKLNRAKPIRKVLLEGKTRNIAALMIGQTLSLWFFSIQFPCGGWVDFDLRLLEFTSVKELTEKYGYIPGETNSIDAVIKCIEAQSAELQDGTTFSDVNFLNKLYHTMPAKKQITNHPALIDDLPF